LRERGGENHADIVEALLAATKDPIITKLIAQRDIRFSNSPIEAINKILKQYLRHYNPRTPDALERVIVHFVQDYGSVRPHGTLKGLIPMEAYRHPDVKPNFRKAAQEVRLIRLEENRKVNCGICRTL
jgi:putative transposase